MKLRVCVHTTLVTFLAIGLAQSVPCAAAPAAIAPAGLSATVPSSVPSDSTALADRAWLTHFELSGGTETPRYDETVAFGRRLDEASPWIVATTFGLSPQGRELPLLIADRDGCFSPEAARAGGKIVVLVQACIHAGEPDGKDAGLMLLRDIAVAQRFPELLDHVTVLFIPIFNVDGHERFGPHNRINQNGPREMGWRATARGLNLNRDYLKADAPEMRAWLRLFNAWLPHILIDTHVTDGGDYQYVITYSIEEHGTLEPGLTAWARDVFVPGIAGPLAEAGYPMFPYVWFRKYDDPASGMRCFATPPRLSTGYAAIQNRPALLVETHMFKDYRTRVAGTYALLRQALSLLNTEHARLRRLVAAADSATACPSFRNEPLAVGFTAGPDSTLLELQGYEYEVVTSDLTGAPWVRYGKTPRVLQVPYFNAVRPSVAVLPPAAYLIPPEWDEVVERLIAHGVELRRLSRPETLVVKSYRFRDVKWRERPQEGRHPLTFEAEEIEETRTYPAGSVVVDLAQRTARVAMHILEPRAPDSYVQWGFFDPIFEQKEYYEGYVMEAMAREMLASDPTLRAEFEAARRSDAALSAGARPGADPSRILDWFYRRTPYWDDRVNVYPVGRIMDVREVPK